MFAHDLAIATAIIGSLSCLAFLGGRKVRANCTGLFALTALVAVTFTVWFQGSLGWATLLPLSSTVLLSNFTPILVAFLAGFSCTGLELRPRTRPLACGSLIVITALCLFSPLIRPWMAPPAVSQEGETKGVVVLQSHGSTCAPASAATLLNLHGIEAAEHEMVGPCLTSAFGTEALGLYRGLKLAAEDNDRTVDIAHRDPDRWAAMGQLPNVSLVRLSGDEYSDGLLVDGRLLRKKPRQFAGPRIRTGEGHAVVVLGRDGPNWKIADPAIGIVTWTNDELLYRFTGEAIFLKQ